MSKTGRPARDLTWQRWGRLIVIGRAKGSYRRPNWLCRCDCGREKTAAGGEIVRGHVNSCGCLMRETMARANLRHGHAGSGNGTPEYQAWLGMRKRCYDKKHRSYPRYGGRGIAVCERWRASFEVFLTDMGPRPSEGHSLDRRDNSLGYEPSNCRWATRIEQRQNTSKPPKLSVEAVRDIRARGRGPRGTIAALSREYRVPHSTIQKVLGGAIAGHVR